MILRGWRTIPRKADGETVPLLRDTMTLIPVSTNGTEKSTTSERSSLIVRDPTAITARWYTTWSTKRRHHQYYSVENTSFLQMNLNQTLLGSYLRALLPNRTYFTNHSIPYIIDFFAMFPISHQIQVIRELDSFRQFLQDINAESFAALLYISSLISWVAVKREARQTFLLGKTEPPQQQESAYCKRTIFQTSKWPIFFLEWWRNKIMGCFIWCL